LLLVPMPMRMPLALPLDEEACGDGQADGVAVVAELAVATIGGSAAAARRRWQAIEEPIVLVDGRVSCGMLWLM
jgi:hypothetical protein